MQYGTSSCVAVALLAGAVAMAGPPQLIYFEEDGGLGNSRGLYNFDTATGLSTLRVPVFGTERIFGMERHPASGVVYAARVLPSELFTIDLDTGVLTFIGSMSNDTIADIAFHPTTGVLYGMGRNEPYRFYTIDPATGAATFLFNTNESVRCGMVFAPDGTLYAFSIDGILSTMNITTGATTLIGGTSVGSVVEDSVFASDGNLYFTLFDGRIYRADPATGVNTLVGDSGMQNGLVGLTEDILVSPPCYANCDGSTVPPVLNVDDFTCFINEFAAAQGLPHPQQLAHYANCDGSTVPPVLNVDDFTCFINAFATGCP